MVAKERINQITSDFSLIFSHKDMMGILLYGSLLYGWETNRSDIDICIVTPNNENFDLLELILGNINVISKKYDIKFFSTLPLFIKIQVIEDGILIYSPNKYDLYEYFYFYRKLWADQKHRQEISKNELLSM